MSLGKLYLPWPFPLRAPLDELKTLERKKCLGSAGVGTDP